MHQIGADDLVAIEQTGELELGADPVGRRDEDRVGAGRGEEPAELANLADDLRPLRPCDALAHPRKRVLGAGDVHPRGFVREAHLTGSTSSESWASSSCTGTR